MRRGRLEAFSDGVLAIVITIMVLEMKIPRAGAEWSALVPVLPLFGSYVLSFVYLAIYWNNHHHLMHSVERVSAGILWTNMHLLFWLSLVPFATAWVGANRFASAPTVLYGGVLLMAGVAYRLLQRAIVRAHGADSLLAVALGRDVKGTASLVVYLLALPLAFAVPWLADVLYVLVACMWLLPDRRIEKALRAPGSPDSP
ncbi:MAG: TMEM175 family protein [Planctomycetota bacterium]